MASSRNQSQVLLSYPTSENCEGFVPIVPENDWPELEDLKQAYDPDWIRQECMKSATTDPHRLKFERYKQEKVKLIGTQVKSKNQTWTVCHDVKNVPQKGRSVRDRFPVVLKGPLT